MKKYLTVFAIDWQNQFIYRLNFILWRVRNVLRLLMTYFLWRGIFVTNQNVFGYSGSQMLTYVFLVLVIQSLILSAPSADNIGGEIGSGDLSNYLVKPVSYLKYWFTRDLSSKVLNLIFAAGEITLLWIVLQPQIYLSRDFLTWLLFLASCFSALLIYYFLNISTRFVAFWTPESTWGVSFLVIVFIEVISGMIFPIDILPNTGQVLLQFTPFPYLIFYPIAILVGKIQGWEAFRVLIQSFIWLFLLLKFSQVIWRKGLRIYGSEGR
jgi:ABC-2 type transport system permease protein